MNYLSMVIMTNQCDLDCLLIEGMFSETLSHCLLFLLYPRWLSGMDISKEALFITLNVIYINIYIYKYTYICMYVSMYNIYMYLCIYI